MTGVSERSGSKFWVWIACGVGGGGQEEPREGIEKATQALNASRSVQGDHKSVPVSSGGPDLTQKL